MPDKDLLFLLIKANCEFGEPKIIENAHPLTISISSKDVIKVCTALHQNPSTYFDMLSCVTGIDNGVDLKTMEVVYNLYSIPFHTSLMLKVILSRENPEVESVNSIWKSANWMEREVFDMYGIHFRNHPDLRRILMPADWKGNPLRKDYKHEEYYRGIKVEY